MPKTARERLAWLLDGSAPARSFSAQLEYRGVLGCLSPSDLWLSDSMPWSSPICSGFDRCASPLPR